MFLVLAIVALALLAPGIIDRINESKVKVAEYEYKTEVARMDHEAQMYTLHMGTMAGVINLALVLGAGLSALVIFLVALYVFDPMGVRQVRMRYIRRNDELERWATDDGLPIISQRR